ncbi:hypothetical protein I4200191B4_14790 [Pseudoflavonifractor gallinarum]|uniref:hypothetical protein n=1 Tax=Pseudoflavonifractor gallinarum TaxID=2779352 RepID=UPI0036F1DC8F
MTQEKQIRLYRLMEKLNWFFHQEMHYLDRETAEKTARECYPEIRDFTYDILWNDLPKEVQEQFMDGGGIPMSTLICSFDGLHDNRVLRYCADFEAHTLHMDTQTEAGEKVSVHFTGLLAHWFENVIQDNILFGMDEITVDGFLNSTKTCWTGPSLTAFPPAAASRNCGSAWNGSTSGYLSLTLALGCADLYWLRRWNCNVYNCL